MAVVGIYAGELGILSGKPQRRGRDRKRSLTRTVARSMTYEQPQDNHLAGHPVGGKVERATGRPFRDNWGKGSPISPIVGVGNRQKDGNQVQNIGPCSPVGSGEGGGGKEGSGDEVWNLGKSNVRS